MNRMEFEAAVPKMAAQFAEQGYGMTTLGVFLQFCRSVSSRLPEDGPGSDVDKAAAAYVDALEARGTTHTVCADTSATSRASWTARRSTSRMRSA